MERNRLELSNLISLSISPTTRMKYRSLRSRWIVYAKSNSMNSLPASENDVALSLARLAQSQRKTVGAAAASAISWYHSASGYQTPCVSPLVKTVLSGIKRSYASPVNRAQPMTIELLKTIVDHFPAAIDAGTLQFHFYMLVAFFGFFRYSYMRRFTVGCFSRRGDDLIVKSDRSKTDKYRAGNNIYISAYDVNPTLCPVAVSQRYLLSLKSAGYSDITTVLPSITHTGKITSASTLTRRLRLALSPHVEDTKKFTLHSLRSGGATAAANAQVPRSLIAMHGRWQSDCVDSYILMNDNSRFSVTRAVASGNHVPTSLKH